MTIITIISHKIDYEIHFISILCKDKNKIDISYKYLNLFIKNKIKNKIKKEGIKK